jgi:hypothetical protein
METVEVKKLKEIYPDEWILLGNPKNDINDIDVISGIPINHSKNKKDIYFTDREKLKGYEGVSIIYTGTFPLVRKMTGIFRRITK